MVVGEKMINNNLNNKLMFYVVLQIYPTILETIYFNYQYLVK